ncbi:hypothetical protein PVAND_000834 [Polypedilum vanderplanki]|uniref:Uncharacterized protein n=1 Tax=Polypedilum vanderplanki TaxID=319348 RepID=A0A9J6BMF8_POLVA|nr:hypothetical protein PVAND_000834 [Polypedilum vanderplanki]
MYTISKAPSKLVATKTRRGLPQNFEKIETIREMSRKSASDNSEFSVPKPVFQQRKSHNYMRSHHHQQSQEILSPQHEELARYMNESWKMVIAENPYDASSDSGSTCSSTSSTSSYVYYVDQPSPLTDFKPFDLESWWGRRLYQNITKSL